MKIPQLFAAIILLLVSISSVRCDAYEACLRQYLNSYESFAQCAIAALNENSCYSGCNYQRTTCYVSKGYDCDVNYAECEEKCK